MRPGEDCSRFHFHGLHCLDRRRAGQFGAVRACDMLTMGSQSAAFKTTFVDLVWLTDFSYEDDDRFTASCFLTHRAGLCFIE